MGPSFLEWPFPIKSQPETFQIKIFASKSTEMQKSNYNKIINNNSLNKLVKQQQRNNQLHFSR